MLLAAESAEKTLKAPKKTTAVYKSLGRVASEVVCEYKPLVSGPVGAQRVAKCLHISASYLHCPQGDNQRTIPSSQQDYRDKIEPKWILHSPHCDLFTKAELFKAFL